MAPSKQEQSGICSPFNIRVLSRHLVKASDPSIKPYVLPVSNIDLITNAAQSYMVCLYPKPSNGNFRAIADTFETHLPSFLNYFFPWAGRIVFNPTTHIPEIHCHNQGAELIIGEVSVTLESLDWTQAGTSLKKILLSYDQDVALSVQVLSFACGGFTIVWGFNALLADGNTAMRMATGWSELLRTRTIAGVRPDRAHHDRCRHFRPRDPPTYSTKVAEMFRPCDHQHEINTLTMGDSIVERLYYVEARDIARLHKAACARPEGHQQVSRANAFSAYLWKVLAGVVAASGRLSDKDKRCGLLWGVDGRHRLSSPDLSAAPRAYLGNLVFYVHREEHVGRILDRPLADVAAMVRDTIVSTDYDELCRDFVDWMEVNKPANFAEMSTIGLENLMLAETMWSSTSYPRDMDIGMDWTEVDKPANFVGTPTIGLGSPSLAQMMWSTFRTDMDFGFGQASLIMPVDVSFARLASGLLIVASRPGGDGSWIVSAKIWRSLAEALEADEQHIFKPLTAEYLGFNYGQKNPTGDRKISRL